MNLGQSGVRLVSLGLALLVTRLSSAASSDPYFPPQGSWEARTPESLGIDSDALKGAIAYSVAHESHGSRDEAQYLRDSFGKHEPLWRLLGPTQPRGGVSGLVVRHGYVAATWGDPDRVDMTHSVSKTFLSTVVGLAWQRGLIPSLSAPVADSVPGDLFASEHNRRITWDHLLRQTSDWSGTLWDIPDWADRPASTSIEEARNRPMHEPGTFYKYNDVRVNLLALCALEVWKRPLPEVLKTEIMDPIGASTSWHWEGYSNSWVTIDGRRMQSVSGGGHFGGGMFINAWDMARFGYLFERGGTWAGRPLVSPGWIALARTPGPANPNYGFANWFLNPGRKAFPSAPESSVCFIGNGANVVYVDTDNDLVVVVRWISNGSIDPFLHHVLESLRDIHSR